VRAIMREGVVISSLKLENTTGSYELCWGLVASTNEQDGKRPSESAKYPVRVIGGSSLYVDERNQGIGNNEEGKNYDAGRAQIVNRTLTLVCIPARHQPAASFRGE